MALQRFAARVRADRRPPRGRGPADDRAVRTRRRRGTSAAAGPRRRTIRRHRRAGRTPVGTPRRPEGRETGRGARRGRWPLAGVVLVRAQLILFWHLRRTRRNTNRQPCRSACPPYRRRRRSRVVSSSSRPVAGSADHRLRIIGVTPRCGIWDSSPTSDARRCRSGRSRATPCGPAAGRRPRRRTAAHSDRWCAARRWAFIRSSPSTNAAMASMDRCSVEPNCRGAPDGRVALGGELGGKPGERSAEHVSPVEHHPAPLLASALVA